MWTCPQLCVWVFVCSHTHTVFKKKCFGGENIVCRPGLCVRLLFLQELFGKTGKYCIWMWPWGFFFLKNVKLQQNVLLMFSLLSVKYCGTVRTLPCSISRSSLTFGFFMDILQYISIKYKDIIISFSYGDSPPHRSSSLPTPPLFTSITLVSPPSFISPLLICPALPLCHRHIVFVFLR